MTAVHPVELAKLARRAARAAAGMMSVAPLAITIGVLAPSVAVAAELSVRIDLARQHMAVRGTRGEAHDWPVSTARPGYRTPTGTFRPIRLERTWYSTIYDYAPMPYSIFFYRGYAIHGTTEIASLGRPASHGCVRLHPDNAKTLFGLVRRYGMGATEIAIVSGKSGALSRPSGGSDRAVRAACG